MSGRRDDDGFTLIELLIVIVVLGILAAVVVFAVNGIKDRGVASGCEADVKSVTVAAEAYKAQKGTYAPNVQTLVDAGLLHSLPSTKDYTIVYQVSGDSVNVSSTACSDAGQMAAYCQAYGDVVNRFPQFDLQAIHDDKFAQVANQMQEMAGLAPDQLRANWQAIAQAFRAMQDIVAATGLSHSDLALLSSGQLPQGFSQQQADQLQRDLQGPFSTTAFQQGYSNLIQDGHNLCNINFG